MSATALKAERPETTEGRGRLGVLARLLFPAGAGGPASHAAQPLQDTVAGIPEQVTGGESPR